MKMSATVYLLHASDASPHLGKIKDILQRLKTGSGIEDIVTVVIGDDLSSLNAIDGEDMVIILLTHKLKEEKEEIVSKLKILKNNHPGLKIAEIIVDPVPYENVYLTFPDDLLPIREREDIDTVWSSIERSLKDMFPAKKLRKPIPSRINWPKYLKLGGLFIGLVMAFFLLRTLIIANIEPEKEKNKNEPDIDLTKIVPEFTASPSICEAPCTIQFKNISRNAVGFSWSFGDGRIRNRNTDPSHTFTTAGFYEVTLTAYGIGRPQTKTRRVIIKPPILVANFKTSQSRCEAPCTIHFENFSRNAHSYTWDFGDGRTSTSFYPSRTFTTAGFYEVTLTAYGIGQTQTKTRGIIIEPPKLVANFKTSQSRCEAPCTIHFENFSRNAHSYTWDFGDGRSSTSFYPSRTFTTAGYYDIILTATANGQKQTKTRRIYID